MAGTLEKAFKDCFSKFEDTIRNHMRGMDHKTALIFYEKLEEKFNKIDKKFRKMKINLE